MTIEEAYKILGLERPSIFAAQHATPDGRQRGATTLMLVDAAISLSRQDVTLIGHTLAAGEILARNVLQKAGLLTQGHVYMSSKPIGKACYELNNGRKIYWTSIAYVNKTGLRGFAGKLYDDTTSGQSLDTYLESRKGPFGRIKVIRAEWAYGDDEPHYNAYDNRNDFVLELTQEGAEQLCQDRDIPLLTIAHGTVARTHKGVTNSFSKWDTGGVRVVEPVGNVVIGPGGDLVDLDKLRRSDLTKMAESMGLESYWRDKQDLINVIRAHR